MKVEEPEVRVDAFVEALRSAGVDVDALGPAPEDAHRYAGSSLRW